MEMRASSALMTHDVRAANGDGGSTPSADIEPRTTTNDKQGPKPAKRKAAPQRLCCSVSGPSQRSVDECAQLFAHRNGARGQKLREEDDYHVVDRAYPEERTGRSAPTVVANLR